MAYDQTPQPQALPGQDLNGPSSEGQSPQASPMSTPQQPKGLQQAAKVHVSMAMDLLSQSLPALGPDSDPPSSRPLETDPESWIMAPKRVPHQT